MKTYDTFENVEGMVPCMKKPIPVQCKQIYQSFRVISLEGDYALGQPGDYLMRGVEEELYICAKSIFEKSYDILTEEV